MAEQPQLIQNQEEDQTIDIRAWMIRLLNNWYWFLISAVVCLAVAFVFVQRKAPTYSVDATIVLRGGTSRSTSASQRELVTLMGGNTDRMLDDELAVMNSKTLMRDAVRNLGLQVTYQTKTTWRWVTLYPESASPILLECSELLLDTIKGGMSFRIEYTGKKYEVEMKASLAAKKWEEHYSFSELNQAIATPFGEVYLADNSAPGRQIKKGAEYRISVSPLNAATRAYRGAVQASPAIQKKGANMLSSSYLINIASVTDVPKRSEDLISAIIELYNVDAVVDKNIMASNTASFIDERLRIISAELDSAETGVERYKKDNQITDISSEAQLFLQSSSETQKKISELETQINLVNYVRDFVSDNTKRNSLIPGNLGITDANISKLIGEYNALMLDRLRLQRSASDENPIVNQLAEQLALMRTNIIASIDNVLSTLQITKSDLLSRNSEYSSLIRSVPTKERQYIEIKRQQQVKEALYLFLFQKREENAITLASTPVPAKVIDAAALTSPLPIAPRRGRIYLIALVLGLALPLGIMILKDYLNDSFADKKAFTAAVKAPFLVTIHSEKQKKHDIVVEAGQNNEMAERFRMLRTNLDFFIKGKEHPVIMVTSAVPSEGKSFVSTNLAVSLSLLKKKTVLVGLDIRKPRLSEVFNVSHGHLTSYLVDKSVKLSDIVYRTEVNEYLDIVPAGAIPPNPTELLQSTRLEEVFAELRAHYDYIVVDTAPIGMVTDTYLLDRIADMTVFVTRANFTSREVSELINDIYQNNRLHNVACVLNGVENKHGSYGYGTYRRYGYGYGYGMSYGYGYGYGHDKEDDGTSIYHRLRKFFKK